MTPDKPVAGDPLATSPDVPPSAPAATAKPIEKKVTTSAIAAYLGVMVLLQILGAVSGNPLLIDGLPDWLEAIIIPVIPAAITFLTGYQTKHTPRADLGE